MTIDRMRRLLAFGLTIFPTLGLANEWPRRPVKLVVGSSPGSAPDVVARLLASRLGPELGQPVIVFNRHGASGQLGMEFLVRSPADGYTIALATMSQAVFNRYLFAKLSYDPVRDLQPIGTVVTAAMAVAVHPSFPAESFAELMALAKARPRQLFVAHPGNGSPPHLMLLMLQKQAAIDFSLVPHHGAVDALNAVLGGQVPILMSGPAAIAPHAQTGKLRALLVTGDRREFTLPGVPTAAEVGLRLRGEAWFGLVAPAGTPSQVIARLNRQVNQILASPEIDADFKRLGFRVTGGSPDAFARLIREEHARWGPTIRELGLKANSE